MKDDVEDEVKDDEVKDDVQDEMEDRWVNHEIPAPCLSSELCDSRSSDLTSWVDEPAGDP